MRHFWLNQPTVYKSVKTSRDVSREWPGVAPAKSDWPQQVPPRYPKPLILLHFFLLILNAGRLLVMEYFYSMVYGTSAIGHQFAKPKPLKHKANCLRWFKIPTASFIHKTVQQILYKALCSTLTDGSQLHLEPTDLLWLYFRYPLSACSCLSTAKCFYFLSLTLSLNWHPDIFPRSEVASRWTWCHWLWLQKQEVVSLYTPDKMYCIILSVNKVFLFLLFPHHCNTQCI